MHQISHGSPHKSQHLTSLFSTNFVYLVDIYGEICENGRHVGASGATLRQLLVLHGPNLNFLGRREPHIYGTTSLEQLNDTLIDTALTRGLRVECKQSNAEHELINLIHAAADKVDFIILNAAGLAHTSVVLRDALLAVQVPFIEVHISNTFNREDFRAKSYLSDIAHGVIVGFGIFGYEMALSAAINFLNNNE